MRTAVVDIGTNSTRLLVADVGPDGGLTELERASTVTRLGDGVDATGRLDPAAQGRVLATLERYAAAIDRHGCDIRTAVLTSAVRDAADGPAFARLVRDRFRLDARTLSGEEEARATFRGATAGRRIPPGDTLAVIDIGGGSTELVAGTADAVSLHASVQVGVVRHTERHLSADPPPPSQLAALARAVRAELRAAVPADLRADKAIAVAGTPTSCAAMDLRLEPYDAARVEGRVLSRATLAAQLARLAALSTEERRAVPGLHPDRAPTIVAGIVVLLEAMDLAGLATVEVSEHDILWGVALDQGLHSP